MQKFFLQSAFLCYTRRPNNNLVKKQRRTSAFFGPVSSFSVTPVTAYLKLSSNWLFFSIVRCNFMLRMIVITISFLAAAIPVCFGQAKPVYQKPNVSKEIAENLRLIEGRVVTVIDGDTIAVQTADRSLRDVRLQGIDAPDEKQDHFKKSRKNLVELLLDKDVNVVVHKKDQKGIYIGSVYLGGRDIGLLQVEWGMAWHYKHFAYEQTAENRKRYAQAETKAKEDRLGLWGEKSPIAPWIARGESKPLEPVTLRTVAAPAVIPAVSTKAGTSANTSANKKYQLGPRGGCYYVSESGRKVYVKDKSLCSGSKTAASTKP